MCVSIPARVVSVGGGSAGTRPASVSFPDGSVKEVDLFLVEEAQVGDYVIVHSGYAVRKIDEENAAETLGLIDEARTGASARHQR